MTRLARSARTAAVVLVLGGGAGLGFYLTEVRPRQAIREAEIEAQRLFAFGRDDVLRARLFIRGSTVSFRRVAEDAFRLEAPVDWPADQEAVRALLDRTAAVRVVRPLADPATAEQLEAWGLDEPAARVEVELRGGRSRTFLIGAENPLVGGHPVTDGDRRRVGLTPGDIFWAFDRPPDAFRDPHPVPEDPARVTGLTLTSSAAELRLRRAGAAWRVLEDGAWSPASPARARRLLVAFTRRLEATRYVSDRAGPEDRARLGLAPPRATARLELGDGAVELDFAWSEGPDGTTVLAHRRGTPSVFEVDPTVLGELGFDADALRDRTLARFDPDRVARVELTLGTEEAELERTPAGWRDPTGRVEVLDVRVDALVRRFAFLEGERTVTTEATPAERRAWLLEPPSRRLVFRDDAGVALADVVLGGRVDAEHLYAARTGSSEVLAVATAQLPRLPAALGDLTR